MKTSHTILALLAAALLATFGFAGEEPRFEHRVKIKVAAGDGEEPVVIETEDLEVGETRQFFTDSGKEVLLTRTEEGYDLEVDGKTIDVGMPHHGHHAVKVGDAEKVFVFKSDHAEVGEGEHVFIQHGSHHGEEGFEWVQDGGEHVDVQVLHHGHASALEHLRAKGILDELDEATRQKIVDALEELQPGATRVKKMVLIEVDEEVHEDVEDDG